MPIVKFTYALKRFYPDLKESSCSASNLYEVLGFIENLYPGIQSYIIDEQLQVRKHVNIFIDGELIKDRLKLTDQFNADSEIYIMQALSGG